MARYRDYVTWLIFTRREHYREDALIRSPALSESSGRPNKPARISSWNLCFQSCRRLVVVRLINRQWQTDEWPVKRIADKWMAIVGEKGARGLPLW